MSEMINPYIAGAPVTEKTMFFGRQDVFEWVQRSLTGKFVDHILVIHGQRRVGKTSVLKQIPNHLPPTYIPVFFDLQGRTHTTIDRFLWRLAKEISRTLRTTQDISLPEPSREEFSRDPELFQNQFLPQLSEAIGDRRLLLVFDEFDSLEEPTAREMLAQDLIPYFSRLMHAPGPLAFVFSIGSSGRKLEHMQASYTDFFRMALYRKISFLEKEEAVRLITQPVAGVIEYEPEAVENIFDITSGHPYFTQLLCHELFGYCQKTGKRRISPKEIDAVLDDVVERGTVNLKFVWDDASDPERYVLTAVSLSEDGRDAQSIHQFLQDQKVRITQREVTDSLRHLQEKDVLASDNSFTVDLMRLWLLENKPLGRVIEELMEVSPIATRYIEIAQEFHETGLTERALDSYRSALEVDAQSLAAQVGIASLTFEQGDLLQAAEEYQKALDIDPEDVAARSGFCQTHLGLGDQLRGEGQVEDALEHYRQVLSVNEQHLDARERLAAHHAQEGAQFRAGERFDEAIEAFERALEFIPDDPQITEELAETQERLAAHHAQEGTRLRAGERFDEAIEAFEKALQFIPDDPAITEQLAETQAARRAKGLATLREAAEEHFRAERWEQAIASFEEYLSMEPGDEGAVRAVEARLVEARVQGELAALYGQAQTALSQKRYDEAVSLLKEIINRDVSYKDATRLLTQAVELQREVRPLWKDIRVLGGAGAAIVIIIGVFLFRFFPGFAPAPTPFTPTPMPTEVPVAILEATATPAPRRLTPTPGPATSTLIPVVEAGTDTPTPRPVTPTPPAPTHTPRPPTPTPTPGLLSPVRTLEGHTSGVRSVAFSPDGTILASGSGGYPVPGDTTVRLWRVADGALLRTLRGHTGVVATVAFSADGTMLASGGKDGTTRLWRVSDGTLLRTLEIGHFLALSPDATILALGPKDGAIQLRRVSDGAVLRSLEGHTDEAEAMAFSPDGAMLGSGSNDHTVRLWRVSDGTLLRTLQGHTADVWSVAFSPDGTVLASAGSEDATVILWDVGSGQQLRALGLTGWAQSVAFSPDGATLATGVGNGTLILWDVESGRQLSSEWRRNSVWAVAFSADRTTLASGYDDGKVILWRVSR